MKKETVNSFNGGLNYDLNAIVTPNNVLTDAVNCSMITFNGDELALQNDAGNTKILVSENNYVKLTDGFYPLGIKEHGGILYITSGKTPNVTAWVLNGNYATNSFVYDTNDIYYKSLTSGNNSLLTVALDWETIGSWNDFANKYGEIEFGSYPSPENAGISIWKGKELDYRQEYSTDNGKDLRLILYKPKTINDELFRSGRWMVFKYRDKSDVSHITFRDRTTGLYTYKTYRIKLWHAIKNNYFDLTEDVEKKFHLAEKIEPTTTLALNISSGSIHGFDNYPTAPHKIKVASAVGFADKGFVRITNGINTLDIDYNGVNLITNELTVENTINCPSGFSIGATVSSPWINYWFMNPYFKYYCPNLFSGLIAISLEFEDRMTFKLHNNILPELETSLVSYAGVLVSSSTPLLVPDPGTPYNLYIEGMDSELKYDSIETTGVPVGKKLIHFLNPYKPTKQYAIGTTISTTLKSLFYLYSWGCYSPNSEVNYIFITSGPFDGSGNPLDPNKPETWVEKDPTTVAVSFSATGGKVLMGATPGIDEYFTSIPEFFTYSELILYTEGLDSGADNNGVPLFGKSFGSEYWNKWVFILDTPFITKSAHYPCCYNDSSYEGASMSSVIEDQLAGAFGPTYTLNFKIDRNTECEIQANAIYTSIFKEGDFQSDNVTTFSTGLTETSQAVSLTILPSMLSNNRLEYKIKPNLNIGALTYTSDDSETPSVGYYQDFFPPKFKNKFDIQGIVSIGETDVWAVINVEQGYFTCNYDTKTEDYYQISVQNIRNEFLNEALELSPIKCVFMRNDFLDKQEPNTRLIGTYDIVNKLPSNITNVSGVSLLDALVSRVSETYVSKISNICKLVKVRLFTSVQLSATDTVTITQGGETLAYTKYTTSPIIDFYVVPNMTFTVEISKPGYLNIPKDLSVNNTYNEISLYWGMLANITGSRVVAGGGGYDWSFEFLSSNLGVSPLKFTAPGDLWIGWSTLDAKYVANSAWHTTGTTLLISPVMNADGISNAANATNLTYKMEDLSIDNYANILDPYNYVWYGGAIMKKTINFTGL